ncbi:MAG: hypothetical protein R8J94_04995 [Acidimicrobiia bacterium]|nr:hypothetical protein [Acidimicrobiia bacterium]
MAKICSAYVEDRGAALVARRRERGDFDPTVGGRPLQVVVNWSFHQGGEHKNLFDLEMLQWMSAKTGFSECHEVDEEDLLTAHPEFPRRSDGDHSIYVRLLA